MTFVPQYAGCDRDVTIFNETKKAGSARLKTVHFAKPIYKNDSRGAVSSSRDSNVTPPAVTMTIIG